MERLDSRQVYANPWLTMREDDVRRGDGSAGIYAVVDKPDYALVIPLRGAEVRLVEQFRYPIGLRRWEFPQGTAPDRADSEPTVLAARELREETGLRASRLTEIGLLDVAPGMSSQRGRVFLATGLTEGEPEPEPEEQDMRSAWFPRSTVEDMIRRGEITDAQTVAAYTLLVLYERSPDHLAARVRPAR
jgi:8-oxo-dGTP pyrophosphatase MutT (NUDIX family)